MYYQDTIELDGMIFAVYMDRDDFTSPPWEEYDCHGPVSDWTSRDKRPGELILNEDRGCKRFYDFAEACRIARREGWGYERFTHRDIAFLGGLYKGTRRQIAALAARADFERLRAWCNDDWYFAVIQVCLLDDYGDIIAESGYLGGVESDCWQSCAEQLARELILDCQKMAA